MIPYGRQSIDDADIAAVSDVLRGDWLTGGPAVAAFEAALAALIEAPHVVAASNGTTALHLAMMALGVGPGDAVIAPSMSFLASANAARYVGADVIFADCDPVTGLMTAQTVAQALAAAGDARVKAVCVVHLNGAAADLASIRAVCQDCGAALIEDACHALGGRYAWDPAGAAVGSGAWADLATFSFHPVKTIAMGEGGAVSTRDPALAERLRRLRNHGMTRDPAQFTQPSDAFDAAGAPNPWYYEMPELGHNFRLSDINCALGVSQLSKAPRFLARRRALARRYDAALAPLAPALRPVPTAPIEAHGLHLYAVAIDFDAIGASRADVMRALRAQGVGTQVHYRPIHQQPYYRALYPHAEAPGADAYYARALSLPLFPDLTDAEQDRVIAAVADVIRA